MATIIDALVVTLGLDGGKFSADLKKTEKELDAFKKKETKLDKDVAKEKDKTRSKHQEAEKRAAKDNESRLKAVDQGYQKVIGTIASVTAATFAAIGFKSFVSDAYNTSLALGKAAKDTGIAARELDALGKVMLQVGGSFQDAQRDAVTFTQALNDAARGRGDAKVMGILARMGLDPKDEKGKVKDIKQIYKDIADVFKNNKEFQSGQEQLKVAQELGLSRASLDLLRKGSAYIETAYSAEYSKNQGADQAVQQAVKFEEALGRIKSRFETTKADLFIRLEPLLGKLLDLLERFGNWVDKNQKQIGDFFSTTANVLSTVVGWLGDLNDKTDGWAGKVLAVSAAFLALKGVITSILAISGISGLAKLLGVVGGAGAAGVAAAGAAGYAAGTYINDKFISGTKSGDVIGQEIALLLASFGHKESRDAINTIGYVNPLTEEKQAVTKGHEDQKKQIAIAHQQNDTLKKAEVELKKLNAAYQKGVDGEALPKGLGGLEKSAYAVGGGVNFAKSAFAALIAKGEGDYTSYNTGTKGVAGGRVGYSGKIDLQNKTINEILESSKTLMGTDKGRMHAVGRYQIIAPTLRGAVKSMGLTGQEKFTPEMQDKIFNEYLVKKSMPKVSAYLTGASEDLRGAIKQMAQIFRSIADPDTGKTYADKWSVANKASIGVAPMAEALRASRVPRSSGGINSSETHIGQITINTNATDAKQIAKDIKPALKTSLNMPSMAGT